MRADLAKPRDDRTIDGAFARMGERSRAMPAYYDGCGIWLDAGKRASEARSASAGAVAERELRVVLTGILEIEGTALATRYIAGAAEIAVAVGGRANASRSRAAAILGMDVDMLKAEGDAGRVGSFARGGV